MFEQLLTVTDVY